MDFFLQYLLKKHWKNMKIFWNIERTFKKYTNICTFFECSFNIFFKNIEEKNLVFYKCSFNILNEIWDLAPCDSNIYKHSSAINAYYAALQALPQLAALTLDIQSHHKALVAGSDGLAWDASKFAIQAGQLDKTIEFLEAGRTIFWSQLLSLCSPYDKLHNVAPELADQLQYISTALELGSYHNMPSELLDNQIKLAQDQETSQLNCLHEEWTNAINSVRCLKRFEDFLQPQKLSSLQMAASKFPVIALVANKNESNIFIMTSTNVHHIPLPSLPSKSNELHRLVQLIQIATAHSKMHVPLLIYFQRIYLLFLQPSKKICRIGWIWKNKEEENSRINSIQMTFSNQFWKPYGLMWCSQSSLFLTLRLVFNLKQITLLLMIFIRNQRIHLYCNGVPLDFFLFYPSMQLAVIIMSLLLNVLQIISSHHTHQPLVHYSDLIQFPLPNYSKWRR